MKLWKETEHSNGDMNNKPLALPPAGRHGSSGSGIKIKPDNFDKQEDFDS